MKATVIGIETHAIMRWARLQCDACRTMFDTNLPKYPTQFELAEFLEGLRAAGWYIDADYHVCPDCEHP